MVRFVMDRDAASGYDVFVDADGVHLFRGNRLIATASHDKLVGEPVTIECKAIGDQVEVWLDGVSTIVVTPPPDYELG